eukprot:TRINITY_DN8988_c0_g1_i1.p1 TRINITY_DN8988_c0_g1~~TRINITY_DN8988_c0_g1_i1.p1  ORF type:complete len:164 (-),score=57.80 TRINITY_DN8988_c0_g1_i1:133-624(-)
MGSVKLSVTVISIFCLFIFLLSCIISMSASLRRVIISTKKAPDAIGPYNQAVQVNSTLYISGQIGFNPSTMEIVSGGVVAEAQQALTNMGHILNAANCNFNNVVKTTVLLADMNDFAAVNDVYTKFFTANYPARAAYQAAALPRGARIEIEAVAVVGDIQTVE